MINNNLFVVSLVLLVCFFSFVFIKITVNIETYQSLNHALNKSINQSINQSIDGWMDGWMDGWIDDRSIDRSINQSINQSINLSEAIHIVPISTQLLSVHKDNDEIMKAKLRQV